MSTIEEWVERMRDVVIRFLIYKRFLPDAAHVAEDEFTSVHYNFGYINGVVDTGYGLLLEIEGAEDGERTGIVGYYHLDEIRIEVFAYDNAEDGE